MHIEMREGLHGFFENKISPSGKCPGFWWWFFFGTWAIG
jgi:hypothetical protein